MGRKARGRRRTGERGHGALSSESSSSGASTVSTTATESSTESTSSLESTSTCSATSIESWRPIRGGNWSGSSGCAFASTDSGDPFVQVVVASPRKLAEDDPQKDPYLRSLMMSPSKSALKSPTPRKRTPRKSHKAHSKRRRKRASASTSKHHHATFSQSTVSATESHSHSRGTRRTTSNSNSSHKAVHPHVSFFPKVEVVHPDPVVPERQRVGHVRPRRRRHRDGDDPRDPQDYGCCSSLCGTSKRRQRRRQEHKTPRGRP